MHYIDTSVLAPFYVPEPVSRTVQKFFGALSEAAISALTEVEFYSALSRRVRMNELSEKSALAVISQFRSHADAGLYRVVSVERRDYLLARDWLMSLATGLRTLDAIHLVVASSNGFHFVTADRRLASAAKALDVRHTLIS